MSIYPEEQLEFRIKRKDYARSQSYARYFNRYLRRFGANAYDLLMPETLSMPGVLDPDENIIGLVYGRYTLETDSQVGRGVLVATNDRVLLLDKKPLFLRCEEFAYEVISGVSYTKAGLAGTLSLFTRLGNIHMRTFNQTCATRFADAVERTIVANNRKVQTL